jgi:hypothetical protein
MAGVAKLWTEFWSRRKVNDSWMCAGEKSGNEEHAAAVQQEQQSGSDKLSAGANN